MTHRPKRGPLNAFKVEPREAAITVLDGGGLNIHFNEVELHQAIKMLCSAAHIDYVIRSDVSKDTVTLSLHKATFQQALDSVMRAVKQPLTYSNENETFQIVPKG